MIDFRYHLVSLISVFLALAVGIVLGAGPLKGPISNSLQEQVDALRTDRDSVRTELDSANGNIEKLNEYVVALAPKLLGNTLTDTTVTIVQAPTADASQVKEITDRFADAGANIVEGGSLTNTTLSQEGIDEFVERLREIDSDLPADSLAATQAALTRALAVGASEDGYTESQAAEVAELFRAAGRLKGGTTANTAAVVYIAGSATGAGQDPLAPGDEEAGAQPEADKHLGVVESLSQYAPTVVAGTSGNAENGLVHELRSVAANVSTVDGIELSAGAVITVLATAKDLEGNERVAYGFADSATAILPPEVMGQTSASTEG